MYCDILNKSLNILRIQHSEDPILLLKTAIQKSSPLLKIVSTKRGSKSIQTPVPINEHKRNRIAIKWIINAADKRKGSLESRIAEEINAVIDGTSSVLLSKSFSFSLPF